MSIAVPDCGHCHNSSAARRWTAACMHSQHSAMSPSTFHHTNWASQNLIKYIEIISSVCFQVAGGSWLLMQVLYEYCREPAERCSSCSSAVHSAAFIAAVRWHALHHYTHYNSWRLYSQLNYFLLHNAFHVVAVIFSNIGPIKLELTNETPLPTGGRNVCVQLLDIES